MPECPNCHQYYFGKPDQCPKCYYHFMARRVIKPEDNSDEQIRMLQEQELRRRIAEEEKRKREMEKKRQEDEWRRHALLNNPHYEYETVFIEDEHDGTLSKTKLNRALKQYADDGWRLHSIFTNELGKNVSSGGFNGISAGTNSTLEVTILIFERCIKMSNAD